MDVCSPRKIVNRLLGKALLKLSLSAHLIEISDLTRLLLDSFTDDRMNE